MPISIDAPPSALSIQHRVATRWLNPIKLDDAESVLEAFKSCEADLREFLPWAHYPQTVESQRTRIAGLVRSFESGGDQSFVMRDTPTGPVQGCISLHRRAFNRRCFEIGYWVRSSATGQGLATLWSRALTVLCFERYGFERVQCCHNELNLASGRVISKVGFLLEGRLRRFTATPTHEQAAAGARAGVVTLMYALCSEDRPLLEWYDEIAEGLTVYDADGHPQPVRTAGS